MKKNYSPEVWTDSVAFNLDGVHVSFYYKTNPADQAKAPHSGIWRKKSEGLMQGCTAKGSKVGSSLLPLAMVKGSLFATNMTS